MAARLISLTSFMPESSLNHDCRLENVRAHLEHVVGRQVTRGLILSRQPLEQVWVLTFQHLLELAELWRIQ